MRTSSLESTRRTPAGPGTISRCGSSPGIQPTGEKHLGNYAGGFRQYAATQEQGEAFFCIVDLHSISVAYDPEDLRERTLDLFAMLVATGLDPDRSTIFAQSHVTAHAEANWLLSAVTSFGELRRMTQFKEKSDAQEFVSAGLFTYPVLQAGDILLYQTDIVPVGIDQRQHIELTRDVAERFNSRYGETFTLPSGVYPGGRRQDHGSAGSREEDVDDRRDRAGDRLPPRLGGRDPPQVQGRRHGLRTRGPPRARETGHLEPHRDHDRVDRRVDRGDPGRGTTAQGYGTFKSEAAESVVALLEPIQRRFREVRDDRGELQRLLALGAEKARAASQSTLDAMYERMGFVAARLEADGGAQRRNFPGVSSRHSPTASPSTSSAE